jgi:tetracycline resistance efflux pump
MRDHENEAARGNGFDDQAVNAESKDLNEELNITESETGKVSDLIFPIIVLIVATIFFMIYTGAQALIGDGKEFNILGAFENTNVGASLCYGGLIGLAAALVTVFRQDILLKDIGMTMWIGAKSMFGAILILFFAWTIGSVIGDMQTGSYLSSLAQGSIGIHWIPVILFLLSGLMAFSTGTSWGTFGIMLPIAGDMAGATDIALILPMLGAVLAGSVFGDHCSPISDTTILSSTGARCCHIDHVSTQLPYALSVAGISAIGYIALGFTGSVLLAFLASTAAFILVCAGLMVLSKKRAVTA